MSVNFGTHFGSEPSSGGSAIAVASTKTTTYAVQRADGFIPVDGSSGAFTVTLPTAVGFSGETHTVKRVDQTLSNNITLATTSAQTIDGFSNRHLSTKDEWITVVSNGTNWYILSRGYAGTLIAFTPGTTSGLGTISGNNSYWKRDGAFAQIRYYFVVGTPSGVTVNLSIPSGLTVDSTVTANIGLQGMGAKGNEIISFPYTMLTNANGTNLQMSIIGSSATSSDALVGATGTGLFAGGDIFSTTVHVAITGWD